MKQRGIALIVVLWGVALLALIAVGVSASTRNDVRLAGNFAALAQARSAAEGGVYWALYQLMATKGEGAWQADGAVHAMTLEGAEVRVAIVDEAARIDLNAAPAALLEGALAAAGIAADARPRLVAAILDWRDADGEVRPNGAEDAEYRAAGKSYGAKNGPFDSVDELSLVLGMTPEDYRRLRPLLTVFSRQQGINAAVAPRETLLAIPGADPAEVERYIALRESQREARLPAPAPPLAWLAFVARAKGAVVSVHAQARTQSGATAHISATVEMRAPSASTPFLVRDWRFEGAELFSS
jgi:general secretion pathway protein K